MNAKKLLVSFLAIMSVLLLVVTVSAASELVDDLKVKVNGISTSFGGSGDISVIAGETLTVEVFFTALETASDVRIEAELEGKKVDSETEVFVGDLEEGKRYSKIFTIRVPYELQDEVSDDLSLEIEIFNGDFKINFDITLRVQIPAYN